MKQNPILKVTSIKLSGTKNEVRGSADLQLSLKGNPVTLSWPLPPDAGSLVFRDIEIRLLREVGELLRSSGTAVLRELPQNP